MVSLGPIEFGSNLGLWGLLSVVPLIILYFIRPKPKLLAVPSLMFLMRAIGSNKLTAFLRQLTKDWLFFIQLLMLLLLALALAQPFAHVTREVTATNSVIVIDASASMLVKEGPRSRFDIAIAKAKQSLAKKNAVILAKGTALVGLRDATPQETREYLDTIAPRHTGTRLGDAIMLAGELLPGGEGRVVVISDFINTEGIDPLSAAAVLKSRGIVTEFVNVAKTGKSNQGFVGLDVGETEAIAYIKNFDNQQKTVTLSFGEETRPLTLSAGATEPFHFALPKGPAKIELRTNDDFVLDNTLWVVGPEQQEINLLLVTNNKSIFLEKAMESSGRVKVTVSEPPVVAKGEYDVYVLHNINARQILTGTFEDFLRSVRDGAGVVIHAQDNMDTIDYKGLLPVKVEGTQDRADIAIQHVSSYTKNIDFGVVDFAPFAQPREGATLLATAGNAALFVAKKEGKGQLFYYGIHEKASDFRFNPGYPIFWTELVTSLSGVPDPRQHNLRTDTPLLREEPVIVKPPTGKPVRRAAILLEESGIYTVGEDLVAANLLRETESAINPVDGLGTPAAEFELHAVKEKQKIPLELFALVLAGLILMLEILYVKLRGDL